MKTVAVSMKNRLFADGASLALTRSGNFAARAISHLPQENMLTECIAIKPDILLIDITPTPPEMTLEGRLITIAQIREVLPEIRVAVICDETAYPTLAKEVVAAKQEGKIDAFYYASITSDYLVAALDSI
ncbi:MAG: response regulator transcription factor [Ruminococcaceae bacterium]|nr:response regulator transcription factor [Oscillospiraceae bacterium]